MEQDGGGGSILVRVANDKSCVWGDEMLGGGVAGECQLLRCGSVHVWARYRSRDLHRRLPHET